MLDNGFEEIAINCAHATGEDALSNIHKDRFDRILIAQSALEDLTLMTANSVVAEYAMAVIRV